jgi:hypothetical protein
MSYIPPAQVARAKQIDRLTYLQTREPDELVHVAGKEYTTKTHDSLKISNGLWAWNSRGFGGKTALDYLIKVRGMGFLEAVEHLLRAFPSADISVRAGGSHGRDRLPARFWQGCQRRIAAQAGAGGADMSRARNGGIDTSAMKTQASPPGPRRQFFSVASPLKPLIRKDLRMQKRTIEIKFRLNHKEADALNKRVKNPACPARHGCATSSAACCPPTRPRPITMP